LDIEVDRTGDVSTASVCARVPARRAADCISVPDVRLFVKETNPYVRSRAIIS
jgi:hypothetical protein